MVSIPRDNSKALKEMATIISDGINNEVYNNHTGRRPVRGMQEEIEFEVRQAMLEVMESLGVKGYVPRLRIEITFGGVQIEARCPNQRDMINVYTWAYRLLEGQYG